MSRPTILVTNDDGIYSRGLAALEEALADLGDVWTVAPQSEQSAVSQAISLRLPVRVRERGEQRFAVSGTPTDCVYIALHQILDHVDLCVSGINHGANMGDDVLYSGTVAGAIEATLGDIPSIAVSLAGYRDLDFDVSAKTAHDLAEQVLERGLPRGVFLNVNVPVDATDETERVICKLGRRNYSREVSEKTDPRNQPYYWLGGSELGFDDMPGSDCNVVADGHISVTPVHLDLTHYRFLEDMSHWDGLSSLASRRSSSEDQT